MSERGDSFRDDVSAAALISSPFLALYVLLWWWTAPSPAQLLASDPLIQALEAYAGLGALPVVAALPVFLWVSLASPSAAALQRGLRGAAAALALAALGLPLLRLVMGPAFPDFIPPEESAAPGMALGVGAAVLEEAVFRLGILALAYLFARRVLPDRLAVALSIVVTGLAFAVSHELGPGAAAHEGRYFVSRFLIPGCAMSALFFRPGPSFLVVLHGAAHVGIALLFPGSAAP